MKITQAGEYALLALVYLARQPSRQLVMADEISRSESIPKGFLSKILQSLSRAGIIRSRQGARGGFALARPAEEITVLDVIEAIEGKIALQKCLDPEQDGCTREDSCTLCAVFTEAQNRVADVFSQMTLAHLLQPKETVMRQVRSMPVGAVAAEADSRAAAVSRSG